MHLPHVLCIVPHHKVSRLDTRGVVTEMEDHRTFRDGAHEEPIAEPVCGHIALAGQLEVPVALPGLSTQPIPTSITFLGDADVLHETLKNLRHITTIP